MRVFVLSAVALVCGSFAVACGSSDPEPTGTNGGDELVIQQSCKTSTQCINGACTCGSGANAGKSCDGSTWWGASSCSTLCRDCSGSSSGGSSSGGSSSGGSSSGGSSSGGSSSSYQCSINGASYSCPTQAALDKCDGGYSKCVSACGWDYGCIISCHAGASDPSGCTRK